MNVPSEKEISEVSLEGVIKTIDSVPNTLAETFLPAAEKLMKEQNAQALAKCLALLSGFNNYSYSLLNGTDGFTTLKVSSSKEYISKAQAISFLHTIGGSDFGVAQVCPDGSAVVDCRCEQIPQIFTDFRNLKSKSPFKIQLLTEIPEITPNKELLSFRQGAIAMHNQFASLQFPDKPQKE